MIVADDNHTIRHSMIAWLMTAFVRARITEAQNGHQVLDVAEVDPPDLVIMDVEMPQLDGLDTTREIKLRWPLIRVIILAMEPHHQRLALHAGADACVLMGIQTEDLLHVIAQVGFDSAFGLPVEHRNDSTPLSERRAGSHFESD